MIESWYRNLDSPWQNLKQLRNSLYEMHIWFSRITSFPSLIDLFVVMTWLLDAKGSQKSPVRGYCLTPLLRFYLNISFPFPLFFDIDANFYACATVVIYGITGSLLNVLTALQTDSPIRRASHACLSVALGFLEPTRGVRQITKMRK